MHNSLNAAEVSQLLEIGVSQQSRRLSLASRNRAPAGAESQPLEHLRGGPASAASRKRWRPANVE